MERVTFQLVDWIGKEETTNNWLQYQLRGKYSFSYHHFHHLATIGHEQRYIPNDSGNNLYWPTNAIIHNSMLIIADNGYSRINIFNANTNEHLCCLNIPKQATERLLAYGDYLIISSTFRVFSLNLSEKLKNSINEPTTTVKVEELQWNVKFSDCIISICMRKVSNNDNTTANLYNRPNSLTYVVLETGQIFELDSMTGNIVKNFEILDPLSNKTLIPSDLIHVPHIKSFIMLDSYKNSVITLSETLEITQQFDLSGKHLYRSICYDDHRNILYICTSKNVQIYTRAGNLIKVILDENEKGNRCRQPSPLQICMPFQSFIHDKHFYLVDYDHHRVLIFLSN